MALARHSFFSGTDHSFYPLQGKTSRKVAKETAGARLRFSAGERAEAKKPLKRLTGVRSLRITQLKQGVNERGTGKSKMRTNSRAAPLSLRAARRSGLNPSE